VGGPGDRGRRAARVLGRGDADLKVADLALLSDCRTAALVTLAGDVVWWPGSRFDGPSVFTRLLDADAGHFSIRPAAACVSQRAYLDGTLVLQTDHDTATGILRVTDALAFAPGAREHEIGHASPDALVRVAEAVDGDVEVEVELVPRPEYGLAVPRLVREGRQIVGVGGPVRLFLADGGTLEPDGGSARARFTLRAGERRGFVLHRRPGVDASPPAPLDADAALADTVAAWRSWTEMHEEFDGPYREAVMHSTRVVQGLTHQPTGAVIAAASCSLPEVPGGSENWDYRFAWLRDASLIAHALLAATCADEAQRYFHWMSRAAVSCRESENVQIVFGPAGERLLSEHELDHLAGFGGSRPVRIGNAAWRQRQHDVLGEVLDVAHCLGDDLELDDFTAAFLCQLVDRAAEQWREPDSGIWERRDEERRHTLSAAMCWVALDRGVRLADALGEHAEPARWARERDEVLEAVLSEAWCAERGTFAGTMGGDAIDASVLLLPLVGLLDADDERMRSTIAVVDEVLGAGGLHRRTEERRGEGAFLPVTFWLAACHARGGDVAAARAAFERAAACANDVGLLAEMADPDTGEPQGNVPQALSHVGLIFAANEIAQAAKEVTA
jgi:GH15 family glucan-1,4-alpha-glucosidase